MVRCLAASVLILENEVYGWDEVPRFVAPTVLVDLAYLLQESFT